jgi:hypothetical protein
MATTIRCDGRGTEKQHTYPASGREKGHSFGLVFSGFLWFSLVFSGFLWFSLVFSGFAA